MTKLINKLVRDNIVEIIEGKNRKCSYKYLNDKQYDFCLRDKLIEESREVYESNNNAEMINEIADVLEVIDTMIKFYDLEISDILKRKEKKNDINGKFEKKIYLISIEE